MLERIPGERNFRCAPNIIKRGDTYQMWYHADGATPAWVTNEAGKQQPVYSERYMESEDLLTWTGAGSCLLPVTGSDEHGLTIGTVWTEDGIYKCIYSVRSLSMATGWATRSPRTGKCLPAGMMSWGLM